MNIINRFKQYLAYRTNVSYLLGCAVRDIQINNIKNQTVNCSIKGVTSEQICDKEVVVSLTTHGIRLQEVYLSIESIMQGTLKPNRIILWLSKEYENKPLPASLKLQMKRGLEVKYCEDFGPFTKMFYTLENFPDSIIITIDDDIIYDINLVDNLVRSYIESPECISANRILKMKLDTNNRPISYLKWIWDAMPSTTSPLNFATGVGGVLYPPHSLDNEVLNKEVILNTCPKEDDAWWYCMALKKGTKVKQCNKSHYFQNDNVQSIALQNENIDPSNCRSDIQLKAIMDRYNLYSYLLND